MSWRDRYVVLRPAAHDPTVHRPRWETASNVTACGLPSLPDKGWALADCANLATGLRLCRSCYPGAANRPGKPAP